MHKGNRLSIQLIAITIFSIAVSLFVFPGCDTDDTGDTDDDVINLSPPKNLAAYAGDSQISLRWYSDSTSSFHIYRSTSSGFTVDASSYLDGIDSMGGFLHGYIDSGLDNGTTYYYVVTSRDLIQESDPSPQVSATPQSGLPSAPENLAANRGDSQVELTWDPVSGATGYNLYRAESSPVLPSDSSRIATDISSPYTDGGLTNFTTYYYVVSAVNGIGEGPPSNEESAKPVPPPLPPSNLSAIPGNQEVILSWDPVPLALRYQIYRSTTSGFTADASTELDITELSTYTDTGLENNTTYYYVLRSVFDWGTSGPSDEVGATPQVPPPPSEIVTLISLNSSNQQANGTNFLLTGSPVVSADGRYVAFRSNADNLVTGDSLGYQDIFRRDVDTETTIRVSVDPLGNEIIGDSRDPAINSNGQYVAFRALTEIYLHDVGTGVSEQVSVNSNGDLSNGDAFYPDISADGTKIVFYSSATNLVGNDTNGVLDVFLHDTTDGSTRRISIASDGTEANGNSLYPKISADGRWVAFESTATNLVPDDNNNRSDIFLHELDTGITTRVSVASDGTEGNNPSRKPAINGNGQYIAFESSANNLVSGDTNVAYDIFVRDTIGNETFRVSIDSDENQSADFNNSNHAAISDDGRYVAFYSIAPNLVSDDINGVQDIFMRDRDAGTTTLLSRNANGNLANGTSVFPDISADGRYVVYYSSATNLVFEDINGLDDAFRVDTMLLP